MSYTNDQCSSRPIANRLSEAMIVSPHSSDVVAGSSKLQLILAGERLFSRLGIEHASLRAIAIEANQKNNNAVRYHFGSKDGLVQAIFRYRVNSLEGLRRIELERLEALGLTRDARSLLEAVFRPHLELRKRDGGGEYVFFMIQYFVKYRPQGMPHPGDDVENSPVVQTLIRLIHERLPYLDEMQRSRRITNATLIFLSALAMSDSDPAYRTPEALEQLLDDTFGQMTELLCAHAPRTVSLAK